MRDIWEKVWSAQCRLGGMTCGSGGIGPRRRWIHLLLPIKSTLGPDLDTPPGGRAVPPKLQIGIQSGAEIVSEGSILRSDFDPKSRPQNETEKII